MTTDPRFDGPGPDQTWRDALAAGRLEIQHCTACDTAQFPPSLVCRTCGAPAPSMVAASGKGIVYSTTTVRRRDGSHNVSVIELAEGPRIMSRVTDLSGVVRIGAEVTAKAEMGDSGPVLVFVPEGSE